MFVEEVLLVGELSSGLRSPLLSYLLLANGLSKADAPVLLLFSGLFYPRFFGEGCL